MLQLEFKFDKLGIISTDDIARFQTEIFSNCQRAVVSKGNDYSGPAKDTFANIRLAAHIGLVKCPAHSAAVRGLDKVMRIINLTDPEAKQAVKDESLQDTLEDLINYYSYVILLDKERRLLSKVSVPNGEIPELSSAMR